MPLDGATILIVESDIAPFVISLQQALEAVGAQSVVAREGSEVLERCNQLQFSAALLNEEHKGIAGELEARGLPVMVYSRVSAALAIVVSLRLRLEN
jgi:DNA-binding response OmpR family regulator